MNQFIPRYQDVDFQLLLTVVALKSANAITALTVNGEMNFIANRIQYDIGF